MAAKAPTNPPPTITTVLQAFELMLEDGDTDIVDASICTQISFIVCKQLNSIEDYF